MKRILLLGVPALIPLAVLAHDVRVDFDHGTHFSCYKTYRWVQSTGDPSPTGEFPNQLMQQRISALIDEALAAKGLKRVAAGGDLLVSYRIDVVQQAQYTTFWSPGPACCWGWGGTGIGDLGFGFSTTTSQTIPEGTLTIDMVAASQNQLVFQGISTHEISSRPERNTKKMRKAVNEIFERYPPIP